MDYVEPLWNKTFERLSEIGSSTPNQDDVQIGPEPESHMTNPNEELAVMVILSVFSVVGTLGNGLVFYVFTRSPVKNTSEIFILALALTDFVTCLAVIPYTVVAIQIQYEFYNDAACKIYWFLMTCIIPLSAFIMVAIAVDRYICICHPFARLMTVKRAKIIVGILVMFASTFGVITALGNSVYSLEHVTKTSVVPLVSLGGKYNITSNNTEEIKPPYEIEDTRLIFNGQCQQSTVLVSNDFIDVYQKIYSACYLCSLLIVFILYGLIYSSVTQQRAKRRAQKNASRVNNVKQVNTHCQTDESTIPLKEANGKNSSPNNANHLTVEMDGETAFTTLTNSSEPHENGIKKQDVRPISKSSFRKQAHGAPNKDKKERMANIKTAVMLFIVTVVFLIAFLPAWLMALRWLPFNMVIFYMYFAYNVANPVIYAFMNQMFRENLCKLFSDCYNCCRNR